jgi:ribosome-binding protein aMBF1 (putative translation factor)
LVEDNGIVNPQEQELSPTKQEIKSFLESRASYREEHDYNHIKEWLEPQLEKLEISKEEFARRCGFSRALVYFYCSDKNRPDEQSMAKMCHVLGVDLEEGLRQYTPKRNGRPPSNGRRR